MIIAGLGVRPILRWFGISFLAGQQTCKETQGRHGDHSPGDDTHGERDGPELR